MFAKVLPLLCKLQFNNTTIEFDLNQPIDLSSSYFDHASKDHISIFGMKPETKKDILSIENDNSSVNVEQITCLSVHNNHTHTETTKHVFKNGRTINEQLPSHTFFGAILITVHPTAYTDQSSLQSLYNDSRDIDNDLIITKQEIISSIVQCTEKYSTDMKCKADDYYLQNIHSFFRQAIILRVIYDAKDIYCRQNSNWSYLTNDAMQYLHENISSCILMNVPSVDREVSAKVLNHKIWFGYDPQCRRFITESIVFSEGESEVEDGLYLLDLQLTPFANTDAVPTRPLIYRVNVQQLYKGKL